MEQRAQLTQNEVQWYKYLNYTARAYLHGWPGVTSTTKQFIDTIIKNKDKGAQSLLS